MNTIHKYALHLRNQTDIMMPENAVVLCTQVQYGIPCVWAMVNPESHLVQRSFVMYGTGHEIREPLGEFIGTIQMDEGALILHVFERGGL